MAREEIRVSGFGGQGVILTAHIIGKAATLFAGRHATMTQAFGPEARGSACSAQVVLDDTPVLYPYVRKTDILVAMSQEAFTKFFPELSEDGLLIYESDLVKTGKIPEKVRRFSIPATRLAEQNLGRTLFTNIVMIGFFGSVSSLFDQKALRDAVQDSVPKGTETMNLKAFDTGWAFGVEAMGRKGS